MKMETDCLFCKISSGKTDTVFLHETDRLVVFSDIRPHAPVHLLIVPKKHIRSINDIGDTDQDLLADLILAAKEMATRSGVRESGYKLLFNVERGGGQVIFHLHLHLIGGWQR
jgi:histidine triad (HIT) family protein